MDAALVIAAVLVLIGVIAFMAASRAKTKRSEGLQEKFGPEYERTMEKTGDQRAAEKQLEAREERREKLQIRDLDPATRERYLTDWRATQTRFVDDPSPAVRDADSLVMNVMRDRGYPVDDFDQRAEDVSVDHPGVADNYRAAHRISLADEQGQATTEDLRQAMVHYRDLFDELLGGPGSLGSGNKAKDDRSTDLRSGDPRLEADPPVQHVDLSEERNPRTTR